MNETPPMTEAMYYILLSLENPVHGYGMMQRIRELSHGRVNMGPGTLYGVLSRMRNDGWIGQIEMPGDTRRKTYVLTEKGRQELFREYGRLKLLVADGAFLEETPRTEPGGQNGAPEDGAPGRENKGEADRQ